jgi:hypothetical protein
MRWGGGRWLAIALIAASMALAACSQEHSQSPAKSEDDDPAHVVKVEGTDLKRVTLTARAADRLGIVATEQVSEVPSAGSPTPVKAVPSAAVMYDKNGEAWVYIVTQPRTYVRASISVDRIEGSLVLLDSGPPVGTVVVTVGGAELLGCELGVGGG